MRQEKNPVFLMRNGGDEKPRAAKNYYRTLRYACTVEWHLCLHSIQLNKIHLAIACLDKKKKSYGFNLTLIPVESTHCHILEML